jgi:hypothetical protein
VPSCVARKPARILRADQNGVTIHGGHPQPVRRALDGRNGSAIAVIAAFGGVPRDDITIGSNMLMRPNRR